MRLAIVHVPLRQVSLQRQQILRNEAPHALGAGLEALLPAAQRLELDEAGAIGDLGFARLHQLDACAQGAARRDQVVDEEDLVAFADRAPLHANGVSTLVLLGVGGAGDGVRQGAVLPEHQERDAQLDGHGGEDEAPGLESGDFGDPQLAVAFRHDLAHGVEQLGVLQQALHVVELLQFLVREIRDHRGELLGERAVRGHVLLGQPLGRLILFRLHPRSFAGTLHGLLRRRRRVGEGGANGLLLLGLGRPLLLGGLALVLPILLDDLLAELALVIRREVDELVRQPVVGIDALLVGVEVRVVHVDESAAGLLGELAHRELAAAAGLLRGRPNRRLRVPAVPLLPLVALRRLHHGSGTGAAPRGRSASWRARAGARGRPARA
mmetsp:Transcript_85192/g.260382  ORF Transcript_85192/g.260382 Transcript_85192/m.260382 type:complete len:381 (+) Transcript_85192:221-1363(+)